MKTKTNTPGIPNYDPATGIHYGVISQNSLMSEAMSDIHMEARDLSYEAAKEELLDAMLAALQSEDEKLLANAISDLYFTGDGKAGIVAHDLMDEYHSVAHTPETEEADRVALWDDSPIGQRFNDRYQGDDHSWLWEKDGYSLMDCLDNDVFVTKSNYFTYAPQCSPCVPNAGNLDSAHKLFEDAGIRVPDSELYSWSRGGLKTYCLSHDFFDDGVAPYPVFSVATGKRVVMVEKSTPCPYCKGTGRDTAARLAEVRGCMRHDILSWIAENPGRFDEWDATTETFKCNNCKGNGQLVNKVEEEQE